MQGGYSLSVYITIRNRNNNGKTPKSLDTKKLQKKALQAVQTLIRLQSNQDQHYLPKLILGYLSTLCKIEWCLEFVVEVVLF